MTYKKTWGKAGRGKYYKRRYNKAVRRHNKGHGKEKAITYWMAELKYAKQGQA